MYGLLSLYLGYLIYLIIFFRSSKNGNVLYKKITIFLGIKLIFLTILYFAFFSHKMSKEQRQDNLEKLIIKTLSYGTRIS